MATVGLNGSAPLEPTDVGDRYVARLEVPPGLFPCGPDRGDPFFAVFFMALEVDLQPAIGAAVTAQTAGDWLGLVPPGMSCPFVTVSGACNPSACRRQQQPHGGSEQLLEREQQSGPPGAAAAAAGATGAAHKRGHHHLSPSIVHLPPPPPSRSGPTGISSADHRLDTHDADEYAADAGGFRRSSRKRLSLSAQVWRAVASLAGALASRAGRLVLSAVGLVHAQCTHRLSPRTCARLEQVGAAAPGIAAAAALLAVALVSGLVRRSQQQAQRGLRASGRADQRSVKVPSSPAPAAPGSRQLRRHLTAWPPRSAAADVAASTRGTSMPGAGAGGGGGAAAGFGGSFAGAAASRRYGRSVSVSGTAARVGFGRHSTDVQPFVMAGDGRDPPANTPPAFTAADVMATGMLSACYPSLASALSDEADIVDVTCRLFTYPAAAAHDRSKAESVSSASTSSSAASAATSAGDARPAVVAAGAPRRLRGSDSGRGHGPAAAELMVSPSTDKAAGRSVRAATASAGGASPDKRTAPSSGGYAAAPAPQPQPRPAKARSLMQLPGFAAAALPSQPSPDLQQQHSQQHGGAATCASILGSPATCMLEMRPSPRPARGAQLSLPGQHSLPAPLLWSAPGAASAAARALKWTASASTGSSSATGNATTTATVTAARPPPPQPLARASCSGALHSELVRLSNGGGGCGAGGSSSSSGGRGLALRSVSLKAFAAPASAEVDGQVDAEAAAGADVAPAATASAALPLPPPPTFLRWSAGTEHSAPDHGCASATGGREPQPAAARRPPPANLRSAPLSRGNGSAGALMSCGPPYPDSLAAAAAAAAASHDGRMSSPGSGLGGGLLQLPPPPHLLHSAPPSRDAAAAAPPPPQPRALNANSVACLPSPPLPATQPPPSGFLSRRSLSLAPSRQGASASAVPPAFSMPPPPLQPSPSVPLPPPPPSLLVRVLSQEARRQAPAPELIPPPPPSLQCRSSTCSNLEGMPCGRAVSQGSGAAQAGGLPLADACNDFVRSLSCGSACNAHALPSPLPAPTGVPAHSMGSPAGSDDASCGGSGGAGTSVSSGAASPGSDSPVCRNHRDSESPVGSVVLASATAAWDALATRAEAGAPSQPELMPVALAAAAKPLPSVRLGPSAAMLDPPHGSPRAVRRSVSHTGAGAGAGTGKATAAVVVAAGSQATSARPPASAFASMQSAFQVAAVDQSTNAPESATRHRNEGSAARMDTAPPLVPPPVRTLPPPSRTSRFSGTGTGGCSSSSSFSCGVAASSPSFRIQLHPCASSGADAADAVATPVLRGARRWSLNGLAGDAMTEEQQLWEAQQLHQGQPLHRAGPGAAEAVDRVHNTSRPPAAAFPKVALPLPPPSFLRPLPLPVPKQRP
ncbi:hypothetical protein HXX76_000631 [Chlamydomonas incerta]|uniref:Uncharacterized protein n=1 Tax=Chlamydomonas incerta TaxID=51695 RepID=A0A835WEY1_CHLIN|nr:hypothetical protein HXX76_000631 [Chlamydomonas incerta]|eukprot:KAG2446029.1 hypothetical protein HXX76_000631 [Chlamydomonas incerta]